MHPIKYEEVSELMWCRRVLGPNHNGVSNLTWPGGPTKDMVTLKSFYQESGIKYYRLVQITEQITNCKQPT